jgi:hypothetical protein
MGGKEIIQTRSAKKKVAEEKNNKDEDIRLAASR